MAAAERLERAAMTTEAREAHRLAKLDAKTQVAAARERERTARHDEKAREAQP